MRPRLLRPLALLAAAAIWLVALPGALHAGEPSQCAVPPEMLDVSTPLPVLAAAIRDRKPVKIIVIGGGSTRGAAAGSLENAYPHRLQLALQALFPDVLITVINQGMQRQSARQMLERFPDDNADKPALIVWEVGISDAVRGTDLDEFAAALQTGIDLAKDRRMDLLLVDMQFSRRATTVIDFERYLNTVQRIGDLNAVYVFPRFAIMRYWSEEGVFNFDDVAEAERARLAAKVYECIGRTLAMAIRNAVR